MKPKYEFISEPPQTSFTAKTVKRANRPRLSQAWHYHPEIEICFTIQSSGKRFVGNTIQNYQVNDLVLFGSNLPHGFTTDMPSTQVVIQMEPEFLGSVFFQKPELRSVKSLVERSKRGLHFHQGTVNEAHRIVPEVLDSTGFPKLIHLFELLDLLANAKDATPICSEEFAMDFNTSQLNRIKRVYGFIIEHYQQDVSVKEAADLLNLSEVAFFKFIKKETKKTFTQIINEFRINHATKLLISTEKTIAEVSFESGYNNISYFNRKFKEVMHMTPTEFREGYVATQH